VSDSREAESGQPSSDLHRVAVSNGASINPHQHPTNLPFLQRKVHLAAGLEPGRLDTRLGACSLGPGQDAAAHKITIRGSQLPAHQKTPLEKEAKVNRHLPQSTFI
jgi:hypothetical protein